MVKIKIFFLCAAALIMMLDNRSSKIISDTDMVIQVSTQAFYFHFEMLIDVDVDDNIKSLPTLQKLTIEKKKN